MQRSLPLVLFVLTVGLVVSIAPAEVTVTGDVAPADSTTWTSSTDVIVGDTGTGEVAVGGGSVVETNNTKLGEQAGSDGTVTLGELDWWDGIGSTGAWTTQGTLTVGNAGTGTFNVYHGGTLTTAGLDIGENGALSIYGGALELTDTMDNQGALNISEGAFSITNGTVTTANPISLYRSQLLVSGSDSSFSGEFSETYGSTVICENGGSLEYTAPYSWWMQKQSLSVRGQEADVAFQGYLQVGVTEPGSSISVTDGGSLRTGKLRIGFDHVVPTSALVELVPKNWARV